MLYLGDTALNERSLEKRLGSHTYFEEARLRRIASGLILSGKMFRQGKDQVLREKTQFGRQALSVKLVVKIDAGVSVFLKKGSISFFFPRAKLFRIKTCLVVIRGNSIMSDQLGSSRKDCQCYIYNSIYRSYCQ